MYNCRGTGVSRTRAGEAELHSEAEKKENLPDNNYRHSFLEKQALGPFKSTYYEGGSLVRRPQPAAVSAQATLPHTAPWWIPVSSEKEVNLILLGGTTGFGAVCGSVG